MENKKVYIKLHVGGAGRWIYEGYSNAWKSLGYDTIIYDSLGEIDAEKGSYYLMGLDGDVANEQCLKVIENSYKTFLCAAPNEFPAPWGLHPNFKCMCHNELIEKLNEFKNVVLWSFGNTQKYHTLWKELHSIPLAFDNISYTECNNRIKESRSTFWKEFFVSELDLDAYFVGGWADNGFDEKREILTSHMLELQDASKLSLGVFINNFITSENETELMYNSKVALNLHDKYQRTLGNDVNERTFKTLGSTGVLVSDDIKCLDDFDFVIARENDPKKYVEAVENYVFGTSEKDLAEIKKHNVNEVLTNHTYVNRVKSLLEL